MRKFLGIAALAALSCGNPSAPTARPPSPSSNCMATNNTKCINFAGLSWEVKSGNGLGPGPNNWSSDNAFVAEGGLHLKITSTDGKWYCAQVICQRTLGYGKYIFQTSGVGELDAQMVFGMFTFNNTDPAYHNREIDIEFFGPRGQFAVQPSDTPGNVTAFPYLKGSPSDTHSFEWREGKITFTHNSETWEYTGGDVPVPGGETVRINLWLTRGLAPANGQAAEVIVTNFLFEP